MIPRSAVNYCFFFQAEDGIRDYKVTGVQTCALPIYLISLINATIAAFDAPGRQSLFPMLVPRGQLQNAITLNAMLFQTGQLVGPAIAGVLIARVSIAAPFFVNAASYFAIIGALLAMRIPPIAARPLRGSIRSELVGGLRYVRASTVLPLVLVVE